MADENNAPVTRSDLKTALREAIQELREYIDERTNDAETRHLRAFRDYNDSANIRFRRLEADTSNIDASTTQRLGLLEH